MQLKPLAGLTKTLGVLLKINIGVLVFAVLAGFYDFYSYATLPADVDPTETMLPSDAVTALVGVVQVLLGIVLGIRAQAGGRPFRGSPAG